MSTIKLLPKQMQFYRSNKRENHFEGGIGTGKTRTLIVKMITTIINHPGKRWILGGKDFPQLHKSIIPETKKILTEMGLQKGKLWDFKASPFPVFKIHRGIVDCISGETYESALRSTNYAGAFFDEVDFIKEEAWLALKGRIRIFPEVLNTASSPFGHNHIYRDFHLNLGENRSLTHMTTYENSILSKDYIQSLEDSYSPKMVKQELKAERLNLAATPVYEFNPDKHVRDIAQMADAVSEIYLVIDYNISKFCGTYQIYQNGILYIIGEEILRYEGSEIMAKKAANRFPNKTLFVIGDSTGNDKRDVATSRTNYKIFREHGIVTVPFKNPSVLARIISVNSNLYSGKIFIDRSCKETIKDLELTEWSEKKMEIDKRDIERSHASDTVGYGDWYFQGIGRREVKETTQKRIF